MNLKNLMMWGVIVLLVMGLFQLFQNPKNNMVADKMPFSEFLQNIDAYNMGSPIKPDGTIPHFFNSDE